MEYVANKVISRIYGHGRGWTFGPKDFSDLGRPETIWQALRRLEKKGVIRKIKQGIYDYPTKSLLFPGWATPDLAVVAQAIARQHGWTIVPDGNTALNILGLSTQVPAAWIFHTDGPSRTYALPGGTLLFTRRAVKEIASLSAEAAMVVQGLKAMGKDHITTEVLAKLRAIKPSQTWQRIASETKFVTAWVNNVIRNLAGESDDA